MRTSLLLLLAGFTAWTPSQGSAQAAQTVPCTVPVASSTEGPWQQISAQGFTFCIPSAWRATGRNTARGDGGSLRWGTGEHRPREVATVTMNGPVGSPPPTLPGRRNRFSETIGGYVAELWDNEFEGRFYTGAQWQTRTRIYLEGESSNLRARDRQLEIYRTVRFTQQ
ncbi:MAG TPA: hypothetical protein VGO40_05065 [Longimicrobium sp.]|jgi:hypothetical protein|nr:hypothetical protein [Longimicrobium sp.]